MSFSRLLLVDHHFVSSIRLLLAIFTTKIHPRVISSRLPRVICVLPISIQYGVSDDTFNANRIFYYNKILISSSVHNNDQKFISGEHAMIACQSNAHFINRN